MNLIPLTLATAKNLRRDTILYHVESKNADGSPQRWRVNGVPKIWKTKPLKVKVPIKHGLYSHGYLTEQDLHLVKIESKAARRKEIKKSDVVNTQGIENDNLLTDLMMWFDRPDENPELLARLCKYDFERVMSLVDKIKNYGDVQDKFVRDTLYLALTMGV